MPSRDDPWPFIDIGLHNAAQPYNGNLRACAYHQGRYPMMLAFLELFQVRAFYQRVAKVWEQVVCGCRDAACSICGGGGCTSCFKVTCQECGGTGWKRFGDWAQGGYRIAYKTGFPVARFG